MAQAKDEKKTPSVWDSTDVKILYEGKQLVLPSEPEKMGFDDAIAFLERAKAAENQRYDVNEMIQGAPWDALVATAKAMQQIYGVVLAQSVQTFFGEIKPKLVTVNTGPKGENIQVAMGRMSLPNITAPVDVGMYGGGCYIMGQVKRKDRDALVRIAQVARHILKTESIYKGKAIHLHVDDDGNLELGQQPDFIEDLDRVSETDMIHTASTQKMINDNIFAPLKFTQRCRDIKIPLKRGILLEGKYGTGKSLTARITAKVATDNEWTFIMLARSQGLKSAIEFAKNYQPCVIFSEDIDRAADREDEDVNSLVNLLDGVLTKNMEMMVVLTTNFIDKIDKALLRPGRFDAIISILPPDAETALKLVHQYGRDLIGASDEEMMAPTEFGDGKSLGQLLDGQIPATIREVVERSKLSMLMEGRNKLSVADLSVAAVSMNRHLALLADKPVDDSPEKKFYDAFHDLIASAADIDSGAIDGVKSAAETIRRGQNTLRREVAERLEQTNSFAQAAAGSAETAKEVAKEGLAKTKEDLTTTQKVLRAIGG